MYVWLFRAERYHLTVILAAGIVIGGAAESLNAHPGTADLTLKRRFGYAVTLPEVSYLMNIVVSFVKIAIQHG